MSQRAPYTLFGFGRNDANRISLAPGAHFTIPVFHYTELILNLAKYLPYYFKYL